MRNAQCSIHDSLAYIDEKAKIFIFYIMKAVFLRSYNNVQDNTKNE